MVDEPQVTSALRRSMRIDLALVWVSAAILFGIHLTVVPSGWILFMAVLVLALTLVPVTALRLLDRGRLPTALVLNNATAWVIMVVATSIAPLALYVAPLVVLSPIVRAIPFLDRRRFALMAAGTIAVSTLLVVVGRTLSGAGLEQDAPRWLLDAIVIFFVSVEVAIITLDAWQNHLQALRQADELRRSRTRIVTAGDMARRQIERDLHDSAQQRLAALAIQLRLAQRQVPQDPARAGELLGRLIADTQEATAELREVAHGVYPPELSQHGLVHALRAVALRCPRPTVVRGEDVARYPADVEATVFFCCREALQNAVKHGGDDVTVTIVLRGGPDLTFEVTDDGAGFDPAAARRRHGLDNIGDRVGAHGGTLVIRSAPGRGTSVRGALPVGASGSAAERLAAR